MASKGLPTAKRMWSMLRTGPDKERQRLFIERHSRDFRDHKASSGFVFFFKDVRNHDTGRVFTSIGCGFPDGSRGITANEARDLIGLPSLRENVIRSKPLARSYTVPTKVTPRPPLLKPKPPTPLIKKQPMTAKDPVRKPLTFLSKSVIAKTIKKLPPKPLKKK